MFSEDGNISQNAVDAEMMRQLLTPGAMDGFLGMDMDMDTSNTSNAPVPDGGQEVAVFPIPKELLVTLPIVEVGPNTKIIHINNPGQEETIHGNMNPNNTPHPAQAQPNPIAEPVASTSGVAPMEVQGYSMEVADSVPPVTQHPKQVAPQNKQQQGGRAPVINQSVPKKGLNTKNRKGKQNPQVQPQDEDPTLRERMALLEQISQVIKNSHGARQNEMHAWGIYVGLKAERIPAGQNRDKLLVRIEQQMNAAIHGGDAPEE